MNDAEELGFTVVKHYDNGFDVDFYDDMSQEEEETVEYDSYNSKDDIVAEIILITQHNIKPYASYSGHSTCKFCMCELNNQYVFELPCNESHVFHRNCYMTYIFSVHKITCITCGDLPSVV